jgi:hypothetical protein
MDGACSAHGKENGCIILCGDPAIKRTTLRWIDIINMNLKEIEMGECDPGSSGSR